VFGVPATSSQSFRGHSLHHPATPGEHYTIDFLLTTRALQTTHRISIKCGAAARADTTLRKREASARPDRKLQREVSQDDPDVKQA
jgi:hypothetical protein